MRKQITQLMTVTLILLFSYSNVCGQTPTFTWDKSELTTAWANSGTTGITVKSENGVTLKQRGTTGVVSSYIGVDNSNPTLSLYLTSSDAVTITTTSEIITSIKITYSSNNSTTTANPYVGYNSTPTAMDDPANPLAIVTSCQMSTGVLGNVGVEQIYTPPVGTKFVILARGATCGTDVSPSVTCRIYRIEVFTSPLNPTISGFTVAGVDATINQSAKTITAELPYGTNLTSLTPIVTLGGTATSYTPTGAQNFSSGSVIYTAKDNGTATTAYAVTISTATTASNDATLSDLKVDGNTIIGFNPATLTYDLALPYTYSGIPVVTAAVNDVVAMQTIVQATTVPGSATVTVTAQDNTTKNIYTVNFTRIPASNAKDITSFYINNKRGVITDTDILIKMPTTTNVTSLTPGVLVSDLATYSPQGSQDFTNPVNYIVTAEDGTQKTYTVTVQLVDPIFTGQYPYETNFPSGYVIPDWMSSPDLDGISFVEPYGSGTTGSDKVLWYDNTTESTSATASVIRLATASSVEFYVSNCTNLIAKLSATGTRTFQLFVNGVLKYSTPSTVKNTIAEINYAVNSTDPVLIKINTLETNGGATLGYLKIDGVATGLKDLKLTGVTFDGKIIQNQNKIDLRVYDTTGRLIQSAKTDINMTKYPRGLYLIKGNGGTLKIIKTR